MDDFFSLWDLNEKVPGPSPKVCRGHPPETVTRTTFDLITKQFELFHSRYQKLPILSFARVQTSCLCSAPQVLTWYDSKPSSKSIPEQNPPHERAPRIPRPPQNNPYRHQRDRQTAKWASKVCKLRLSLAPVLSRAICMDFPICRRRCVP